MPNNEVILNELDSQLLKEIRKLASANLAPSDIARYLEINKSAFLKFWRKKDSEIRKEYEAGRLDIQLKKIQKLNKQVKKGNLTAIQIHDKLVDETDFQAKKKEIFGLE